MGRDGTGLEHPGLTCSRDLLRGGMERDKAVSLVQVRAVQVSDVVWNYLETFVKRFPYVGCHPKPHPV